MDAGENVARSSEPRVSCPTVPKSSVAPRRALYRVPTADLDLQVSVRAADSVWRGLLLDISAGGCSARVPLPISLRLDERSSFDVELPLSDDLLICSGELVGLEVGGDAATLRLRFRRLRPHIRSALLSWIGGVVTGASS